MTLESNTETETDAEPDEGREWLECVICMQEFVCPRVLPCGHTFCLNCIKSMSHRECAIDRTKYHCAPDDLPINYQVFLGGNRSFMSLGKQPKTFA